MTAETPEALAALLDRLDRWAITDDDKATCAAVIRSLTAQLDEGLADFKAVTAAWGEEKAARKKAEEALAEMTRRRDAWREKADGYDELAAAVRAGIEKAGDRTLSRVFMRGALVDSERRRKDAEAKLAAQELTVAVVIERAAEMAESLAKGVTHYGPEPYAICAAHIRALVTPAMQDALSARDRAMRAEGLDPREVLGWLEQIANPTLAQSPQGMARNYAERVRKILAAADLGQGDADEKGQADE